MRRHSNTAVETTAAGSIAIDATSITLAAVTGWPVPGTGESALAVIGSELIEYTGISTATLTGCLRGRDGTTAAAHDSGVAVKHCGSMYDLIGLGPSPLYTAQLVLPGVVPTLAGTLPVVAGNIYWQPIRPDRNLTVTGLYSEVSTAAAAGKKYRMLLYELSDTFVPKSPVYGSGEFAADATAVNSVTGLSLSLVKGKNYATGVWSNGGPTLRAVCGYVPNAAIATALTANMMFTALSGAVAYHASNTPDPGTAVGTAAAGGNPHRYPVFLAVTVP